MVKVVEDFEKVLEGFQKNCDSNLKLAKEAFSALCESVPPSDREDEERERLKLSLEHYIDLFETRLGPALGRLVPDWQTPAAQHGKQVRAVPRFERVFPVRVAIEDGEWKEGSSRDIGAVGLFVMARTAVETGQILELEIELPEVGPLQLSGEVVWTKRVPRQVPSEELMGFGVKVTRAPKEWYAYFLGSESDWQKLVFSRHRLNLGET